MTDEPLGPLIYGKIADAMADIDAVAKRGEYKGDGVRYNFRGVDDVVNAVGPILRKHRIVPGVWLEKVERRDTQTTKGNATRETTVEVLFTLTAEDGSSREYRIPGEALDTSDKGTAKAMSVAYRIWLIQAFAIPTDEPDPDSERHERGEPPAVTVPAAAASFLLDRIRPVRYEPRGNTADAWAGSLRELPPLWDMVVGFGAENAPVPGDAGRTWRQLLAERYRAEMAQLRNTLETSVMWKAIGPEGLLFQMPGGKLGDLLKQRGDELVAARDKVIEETLDLGLGAKTLAGVDSARSYLDGKLTEHRAWGEPVDKTYAALEERGAAIARNWCEVAKMDELHDALAWQIGQADDEQPLHLLAGEVDAATGTFFDKPVADDLHAKVHARLVSLGAVKP
jgi:hypothetical protein